MTTLIVLTIILCAIIFAFRLDEIRIRFQRKLKTDNSKDK